MYRIDLKGLPDPKPKKVIKQKFAKIRRRSSKRLKEEGNYRRLRVDFLKGKICPVTNKKATEIHHIKGRVGYAKDQDRLSGVSLLNDQRFWLAVSSEGHKFIHNNHEWSVLNGFMEIRSV